MLDDLNASLARGRERALAREGALAGTVEEVFREAGRTGARRFRQRATRHVTAAANGNVPAPWTQPHPDEVIDVAAVVSRLRTKTRPVRLAAAREVMAVALDRVGVSFDVTNPLVGRAVAGAGAHVGHIGETTRIMVMRTINVAYEAGLSVEDTATAITTAMAAAAPARARLIASTELAAVANGGAVAATRIVAQATGETWWKRWTIAPGADWPRHEDIPDLDGQLRTLDAPFDVDGEQMQYPGDPAGTP